MEYKIKKFLKIFLLFAALYLMNLIVLKVVGSLGFDVVWHERNYIFPPLFATGVLLFFEKRRKSKSRTQKDDSKI